MESNQQAGFTTTSDFNDWVKAVWQVVDGIPRGHVLTYGEVARLAGMSRAARRVSQAMRRALTGTSVATYAQLRTTVHN